MWAKNGGDVMVGAKSEKKNTFKTVWSNDCVCVCWVVWYLRLLKMGCRMILGKGKYGIFKRELIQVLG